MKIAVIGRGSAGSLAAAHVSLIAKTYSACELFHIFDPDIPIIGVGEGTLPGMPSRLMQLTGLSAGEIEDELKATKKFGVQFENWGSRNPVFRQHFYPRPDTYGYHLNAPQLVELLGRSITATEIHSKVTALTSEGAQATISFADRPAETFDLVFDARGFPKKLDSEQHIEVPFIPTNKAIIRRGPPAPAVEMTRAVARPHGWIFVIPLQSHTSYGYIHNGDISPENEVNADFDTFLAGETDAECRHMAAISFPNFLSRTIYDGAIAKVGNVAGFMEPLEATALGLIERQISVILDTRFGRPAEKTLEDAPVVNRHLLHWAWRYGVFIAWHYSQGSAFKTPFWDYAHKNTLARAENHVVEGLDLDTQRGHFAEFVSAGIAHARDQMGQTPKLESFSGFPVQNFGELAAGLDAAGLDAAGLGAAGLGAA